MIFDKTLDTSTCWESALTHLDYGNSDIELNDSRVNHYNNMDLQLNIYKDVQDEKQKVLESTSCTENPSLWYSVSSILKSVVNNIPTTSFCKYFSQTSDQF